MSPSDLLLGRFEHVATVGTVPWARIVIVAAPDRGESVLLLPDDAAALEREQEALSEVAGPGVPAGRPVRDEVTGRTALRLDVPGELRTLSGWRDLPPETLRTGLVQMLSVLSRAHLRGRVHTRLREDAILAAGCGDFWMTGWAASRRLSEIDACDGFSPVARDVRDLGVAFVAALVGRGNGASDAHRLPSVDDLGGRGADRDFRRVLSRLLAPDPRDAYGSAGEVLADLGHPDTLDPWELVPFVERGDALERILRAFGQPGPARGGVAAVEIVGPHGSGRSRLLSWVATALRARGALVLAASAGSCTWGGLAPLARQLAQIVGRDGAAWTEHANVLESIVGPGEGPTDGLVLPAAAALTDLLAEAFRESRGVLLLDDEDQMPVNAAEVWRSLRRQAAARLGSRVLFVSSRVGASRRGDDARSETVELGDWSVSEIRRFLEGVLAGPEVAGEAASILRDLAGGRPAEIVGFLRDLERGGSLRRTGDRWRLDVPLHALPEWTPTDGEVVRRALEAAGRDAALLVDVLAVAARPLDRPDCGRLAELPGPRLWGAAERADEAGLIRRDGSTWRLRSEHIRGRVLAAMPTVRRRSLHREVLALVQERSPDDPAPQATHARAAGHPDASALTRRAVDALVGAARFDSAIAQLVDAEECLGDPDWGRAAWAERIDLLRLAGRLGEALELVDRLLAHPETTPAERSDALVRRIHVLYESRDWDAVVAQDLPEEAATPEQLAELRFLRAAAYCELCERTRADRDSRLAEAELGSERAPSPVVDRARQEFRYKRAFHDHRRDDARRALVDRMRIARRSGLRHLMPFDAYRLASLSYGCRSYTHPHRVVRRADEVIESVAEGARHVRAAQIVAVAFSEARQTGTFDPESAHRFALLYEQTQAPILASTARVRRVFARVLTRDYDTSDLGVLNQLSQCLGSATNSELLAWSHSLAVPLELLGFQPALEVFSARVADLDQSVLRVELVGASLCRSRLYWSTALDRSVGRELVLSESIVASCPAPPPTQGNGPPPKPPRLVGSRDGSLFLLASAWAIRSTCGTQAEYPPVDQLRRLLPASDVGPGNVALALALGIWTPGRLDDRDWMWIAWIRQAYDGAWFPAFRWQAHLVDAKLHWRAGRLDAAERSVERAREQAHWLRSERFGEWGVRECDLALRTIHERSPVSAGQPRGPRRMAPSAAPAHVAEPGHRRQVVFGPTAAALRQHLAQGLGGGEIGDLVPGVRDVAGATLVLLPELLSAQELRGALAAVRRARAAGRRVLACSVLRESEVLAAAPGLRLVLEAVGGRRVRLGSALETPEARVAAFEAALRRSRRGLAITPAARATVAAAAWAGGAAEIDEVARLAASIAAAEVTEDVLGRCGVREAGVGARGHDGAILSALGRGQVLSVSDLEEATGLARRTLQRRLSRLVERGVVARQGRGPATRYRAPGI